MEHLHHFKLTQDPFQNEPDLRFYFDSAYHSDVQRRVERALRQQKGLCVLTGEGGTGKTLLARRILDSLEEEIVEAILMVILPGAADAESVLTRFARQVGVEEPAQDRSALLAQIYEQLAIVREDGRHCVLILDDAQILSRDAMAEVGGLLNLEYEDRRLLSLLLVGLPELDVKISHEQSLSQRVDVRVHLMPLDLDNTTAYLAHRLEIVGGSAEVFAQDSLGALFKFSRGRPRLVNTIADNALFEAYLAGRRQVSSGDVERAAADLGIGSEPGSTYQDIGQSRTGPPPALPTMELDDPVTGIAEAEQTQRDLSSDDDPGLDLGELLEAPDGADADDDVEQLTTVIGMDDAPALDTRDLDAEVADLSAPESGDGLPAFSAANSGAPSAEATRVAFLDELSEPEAEPEPALETSASDDEIDDLFVELIDD